MRKLIEKNLSFLTWLEPTFGEILIIALLVFITRANLKDMKTFFNFSLHAYVSPFNIKLDISSTFL